MLGALSSISPSDGDAGFSSDMKRETRRQIRELAFFASLGISVALSIVIGLGVGVYLDRYVFHTTPWLTLIGMVLGIIAGYRNIGLAIKKVRKL